MTQTIFIQYIILVSNNEWGGPFINFYQWIPQKDNSVLTRIEGDITSRLWLDRSCINVIGDVNDEELIKHADIAIDKVFVDIEIANVTDELAQFIYDERDAPSQVHYGIQPRDEDYERLKSNYCELGKKVLQEALTIFNRLISFARNYKGQFWLYERTIDFDQLTSLNNHFGAQVKLLNYDWIRWCPLAPLVIHVTLPNTNTSIRSAEWDGFQKFISKNSKPDFVLELLTNAELFIAEKRRRNAIIEAVSALEIAVARFSQSPKLDELRNDDEVNRINIAGLKNQFEHMGFSGTVGFILPLLFPVERFPTEILKNCQDAIDIRNNVIHNGQRDIEYEIILSLVSGIRKACEILDTYTDKKIITQ